MVMVVMVMVMVMVVTAMVVTAMVMAGLELGDIGAVGPIVMAAVEADTRYFVLN